MARITLQCRARNDRVARLLRRQRGLGMIESLIALTVLSVFALAVTGALSTAARATGTLDRKVTAESLARSQLEVTKEAAFQAAPATYASLGSVPSGYSVSAVASSIPGYDSNKQKITVTVTYAGQTLLQVEDYKVNR